MNCDTFQRNWHRSFSRASLLCLLAMASCAQVNAANAPQQLSSLEQSIAGSVSTKLPIEKRVQNLELKVYSKVQKGSLKSRINALEQFAGIAGGEQMPPLAPASTVHNSNQSAHATNSAGNSSRSAHAASAHHSSHARSPKLEDAIKLHQDGKIVEAEKSFQQIVSASPGNADAYFSLGAIAESRGDLHTALDYYTSAIQANPADEEARTAVADLSQKITAANSGPFINPLAPPDQQKVLQGHALDWTKMQQRNPLSGQAAFGSPPIPTLGVSNPNQAIPTAPVGPSMKSVVAKSVARSLARAALGAALGSAGLHCPACQLLRF